MNVKLHSGHIPARMKQSMQQRVPKQVNAVCYTYTECSISGQRNCTKLTHKTIFKTSKKKTTK